MVQVTATLRSVKMHHHPDATRHPANDFEFLGADERDIAQAESSGRCRRKLCVEICRCREQDTHERIVVNRVAFEHLRDEGLSLGLDLRSDVAFASGRAAQSQ